VHLKSSLSGHKYVKGKFLTAAPDGVVCLTARLGR